MSKKYTNDTYLIIFHDENYQLIPKIPWDQKLVDCCLGSFCEEFFIFFNFLF
jgi:hypothetical protein